LVLFDTLINKVFGGLFTTAIIWGAFDGQDRETGYDTLIISCLNLMFDAPKG